MFCLSDNLLSLACISFKIQRYLSFAAGALKILKNILAVFLGNVIGGKYFLGHNACLVEQELGHSHHIARIVQDVCI